MYSLTINNKILKFKSHHHLKHINKVTWDYKKKILKYYRKN